MLNEYKVCEHCGKSLPVSMFTKDNSRKDNLNVWCRICTNTAHKIFYQAHKRELCAKTKEYRDQLKRDILTHYGNGKMACARCGLEDIRVLTIDHISGKGAKHRASLGGMVGGYNFYLWLKRNNYPIGYQTLCINCQWIKIEEDKEHAR